ncbi:protein translocase subunit secF /protein translocase subunit secD [Rhizobium azibense]|uniref:Multifunctional fusion protein n=1 Tax=Rhizobium azibense TaxID=1136135 RepID=A0A4R3QLK6_9HYPH|nr:protein translocase subunit SecDF [Rhizobium azibense]TCU20832.1 protein translocase subunit secF /protein translocase subunit secD [Rhizobium azibense]
MLHFSRWKTVLIWLIVLVAALGAAPNLFTDVSLPGWMPQKRVALGLDLQGGSHIVLKAERSDIVRKRLENTVASVRARLREAGIRYTGLAGNGQTIQVRITDPSQIERAVSVLRPLTVPEAGAPDPDVTLVKGNDGQLTLHITGKAIARSLSAALTQSVDIVGRRAVEVGGIDPVIETGGPDRLSVQVPGLADPQRFKDLLSQDGRLSFHLIDSSMSPQDAMSGTVPARSRIVYSQDDPPDAYLVERTEILSSADLSDFQVEPGNDEDSSILTFRFNPESFRRFAELTQNNVGRSVAILLDDQVIAAPDIREPVAGNRGEIPLDYSQEETEDLAAILRSGALPVTLTIVEERTIDPGFGAGSILSGLVAGFVGAVLVIGLMVAFFGILGVIAGAALVVNVMMILAVLSLSGAPLTLPGVAGIVLTIGIAVDATVLIYERIREEVKGGTHLDQAIGIAYSRAFMTVVDANITTLIAAAILFYLGSDAIRGFAVTLAIGILTTAFTAFVFTRPLVVAWVRHRRLKHLPKSVHTDLFDGTNIRFMGIRRYSFTALAALSLVSMLAVVTIGMNLGIDFTGGSVIEVRSKQGPADLEDIRTRLSQLNLGDIQARRLRDATNAIIRIEAQGGGENAEQSAITLVRSELADQYDFRRVEVVGPAVSGELTKTASLGVLASLGAILVYIWLRFEWQFAVGAIIATLHDVILTLGSFVVTGIEFNLTSIAALLVIVGYSLNDTVVVYDRMRENLKHFRRMPLPILIDASINQTLSRTILTSATTLLALAALYLFGGEDMRSFALVMLFGVAVGTFSSIYIAAPVLILFRLRPKTIDEKEDGATDEKSGKATASHG